MAADIRQTGRMARRLWYGALLSGAVIGAIVGGLACAELVHAYRPRGNHA